MKTCPECAEEVRTAALVCRFCYHRFADRAAKAQARLAATELESCRAAEQRYDGCDTTVNVELGTGRGQVELVGVGGTRYRLVAHSESGRDFAIVHRAGTPPERSCAPAGRGGCEPGGRW